MRQDKSNVRQKCGSRFRRRISVEFNSFNWIRHGRNGTYALYLYTNIIMLLAGSEVRIVKSCDRGLENAPRSQFLTIRTVPKPDNNMFIFFLAVNWLTSGFVYATLSLGSLRNHGGNGNGNVTEQKVEWAEQWLCTCAIILGTFLCRPLQNSRDLEHRRRRRRRRQIIPRKNWDGTVRSRYEDRNLSFARRERERKQKNTSQ